MNERQVPILRHSNVWQTRYRNIAIEIRHQFVSADQPFGVWVYYLFIPKKLLPDVPKDYTAPNTYTNYYYDWFINRSNIIDFHGGVTYCHECAADMIKVGCDYNHYWDQDMLSGYDQDFLLHDAMHTVDTFLDFMEPSDES